MNQTNARGPILLQGAMEVETDRLISLLDSPREDQAGPWRFVRGMLEGVPVVVSPTGIGMANAAAATALAVDRYRPAALLNQGTAGGHHPKLHRGDILVGARLLNMGAFSTPSRGAGEGTDPACWQLFPIESFRPGEGWKERAFLDSDPWLLQAARQAARGWQGGRVEEGTIASADQWNREADRILWLWENWGSWAEDMETYAAAQVAAAWGVPFLGVRILSNHELHQEDYNRTSGELCQEFVRRIVRCLRSQ